MSVIGTGVAAGVAQAAHNAQQVARQRDKRAKEPVSESERMREAFETHLRAVEEGDEGDAPTQLRVNSETSDDASAEREETLVQQDEAAVDTLDVVADDTAAADTPAADTAAAHPPPAEETAERLLDRLSNDAQSAPLYQHLDVKA